jgi:3-deoxy-7-phosphoheptulonate synthase
MMLVVMQKEATVSQIGAVLEKTEALGLNPHPSRGPDQTIIGVVGGEDHPDFSSIQALSGVESLLSLSNKYKLVSREFKGESTVVNVLGVPIGGRDFVVMAGPCAVESREQILATARAVGKKGARILRGGAFKPRTSPYSFRGLGVEGLELLAEARRETGLPIITEVTSPKLVDAVAQHADVLQIGARNMQNYALLEAAGQVRKPVMLKRGMMSTIEELLLAAEYIHSNGNNQIILCERGIRSFERATRNTLDISAIAVLKEKSHLPVIVDPSHAVGHRPYVASAALAAAAAGADGIIVEVHPSPDDALSDGAQSLSFEDFAGLMDSLIPVAQAVGRSLTQKAAP